jgi:hypothetical protein
MELNAGGLTFRGPALAAEERRHFVPSASPKMDYVWLL